MSQQSLGDDLLSQSQAQGGRKRKRAMVPGGKVGGVSFYWVHWMDGRMSGARRVSFSRCVD